MTGWFARLSVVALAFVWLPGVALAQGLVVSCPDVAGSWAWSTGGVVTMTADGHAQWAPAEGAPPAFEAGWICDETSGEIVISWQQGVVDRLRAEEGGARLAGTNQFGVEVAGVRPSAAPPPAPAGPVPPWLVGTWLLEIRLPSPEGPVAVTWRIEPDGHDGIDAGPFSHAGRMTAAGGRWQQEAETKPFEDGGSYQLPNWATLITVGRFGAGRWHRRAPALRLSTVESGDQLLPSDLSALVEAALGAIAGWRPDAVLVGVEFERPDSNRQATVEVELRFASTATGAGLVVWVAPEGARFFTHDVVSWGPGGIPTGFMDLPTAWAIARQHGLVPPLDRASLAIWRPDNTEPVLAWSITSARGQIRGVNLDAATGALLEGDLSGYIADYDAQWEAAVAGLRRLFAQPHRSSGGEGPSFSGSSSSSSSSSSSDSSSSSSGYDTGAQNAWESGDMQAYDRIVSGTPTGDDCYNYGGC